MFACSLALLASEFRGRERGTAYGIWGATIAAAAAVGPLVGGGLTEGLGWEYIFFLNVPIGVVAIALSRDAAARVAGRGRARRRLARDSSPSPSACSCSCWR